MSSAWAGGTDAIIERMDKMTALYIEEARKSIYTGESAVNCEECGEPIPEQRRKVIACKYCLPCQAALAQNQGKALYKCQTASERTLTLT